MRKSWVLLYCKLITASWGQSAGAESVGLQMLAQNGDNENLFWGAVMQSGPPPPVGNITHGQKYYDDIVAKTNCVNASDTLQCLRDVPYGIIKKAIDATPNLLSYQVSIFDVCP